MDTDELLSRFAVALGIGLLIGLERGWRARAEKPGSRTAGIRTFAISGLLGGVVGALAQAAGGAASAGGGRCSALALAAYAAVITIFCREENRADKTFSATTAIAGIADLRARRLCAGRRHAGGRRGRGCDRRLLALRESLHGWVKRSPGRSCAPGWSCWR